MDPSLTLGMTALLRASSAEIIHRQARDRANAGHERRFIHEEARRMVRRRLRCIRALRRDPQEEKHAWDLLLVAREVLRRRRLLRDPDLARAGDALERRRHSLRQ